MVENAQHIYFMSRAVKYSAGKKDEPRIKHYFNFLSTVYA